VLLAQDHLFDRVEAVVLVCCKRVLALVALETGEMEVQVLGPTCPVLIAELAWAARTVWAEVAECVITLFVLIGLYFELFYFIYYL
jgi:hypothetical protein